jgi:iron complex outermembrane receptor protein
METLIGATVKVKVHRWNVTDLVGLSVAAPANAKQISVSYVGYYTSTLNVASETMNISMNRDSQTLNDVVVIGYGVRKKNDLTGSVATIGSKDFNKGMISSAEELMNGKIAGVQIVNGGGSPTAGSTIRVRGGASLNASNDPLIVLDGVPMEVGGSSR